jgi:hypothetical protein
VDNRDGTQLSAAYQFEASEAEHARQLTLAEKAAATVREISVGPPFPRV